MPRVSVLMPAYDSADCIAASVRSVLHQTVTDFELLVISDDGRDYPAVLHHAGLSDPRIRHLTTCKTASGAAHARNIGLQAARGRFIAMLDSDDAFHPEKLALTLPLAAQHGMVSTGIRYLAIADGMPRNLTHGGMAYSTGPLPAAAYPYVNYQTNAMLVFDRERIPHHWPDLTVMEDLVFAMQAYSHVPHIWHMAEPLHDYIRRHGSLTNRPDTARRFIAAKRRILRALDTDGLGLTHPEARETLRDYVTHSLLAEKAVHEAQQNHPAAQFTEFFRPHLSERQRAIVRAARVNAFVTPSRYPNAMQPSEALQ